MKIRIVSNMTVAISLILASCGSSGIAVQEPRETETATEDGMAETEASAEQSFICERTKARPDAVLTAVDIDEGFAFDWKPGKIAFPAGKEVNLKVMNRSYADHDFSADGCYSGRIPDNKGVTLSFVMPARPLRFVCGLHAQSMAGRLEPT